MPHKDLRRTADESIFEFSGKTTLCQIKDRRNLFLESTLILGQAPGTANASRRVLRITFATIREETCELQFAYRHRADCTRADAERRRSMIEMVDKCKWNRGLLQPTVARHGNCLMARAFREVMKLTTGRRPRRFSCPNEFTWLRPGPERKGHVPSRENVQARRSTRDGPRPEPCGLQGILPGRHLLIGRDRFAVPDRVRVGILSRGVPCRLTTPRASRLSMNAQNATLEKSQ
jgi:hypothetical protein